VLVLVVVAIPPESPAHSSLDSLLYDIRHSVRKLIRTPGFTLIALFTIALGIGATTAMFSIVDGIVLKPLAFRNPEEIVRVASTGREGKPNAMSALDYIDYRDQSTSFVGMAAIDNSSFNLTGGGVQPQRLNVATVGGRFFELLGVAPQHGRFFAEGADATGAPRVVVLSDGLWRTRFGADEKIIGRHISLNGREYEVLGVAQRKLNYPERPDAWIPMVLEPWMIHADNRGAHWIYAIGRVKSGVPISVAKAEVSAVATRLARQYPESNTGFGGTVESLHETIVGKVTDKLYAMFGAVGFVLLIACANVANLLLVRAAGRESEIAVRTALGAARGRIIRQLVTESAVLAVGGAILGTAVAMWIVAGVIALGGAQLPRLEDVVVDARALGFTALLAVVTGVLFGLAPAAYAARTHISEMLRSGARGATGRRGAHRTRNLLVVTEFALAMVLLIGSGLLIRSFAQLMNVDPGFNTENVVRFSVSLPASKYPSEREVRTVVGSALDRLRHLPGTEEAAVSFSPPMSAGMMRTSFDVEGEPPRANDNRRLTIAIPSSPNYFRTLRIPLVRGRMYTEAENGFATPPVVVVNEALVRQYFPNENPIGKRLTLGIAHDTAAAGGQIDVKGEIVGVVADIKQRGLARETDPATFFPYNTFAVNDITFLVRSTADEATLAAGIRSRMREVDPDLPLFGLQAMSEVVSQSVAEPRFFTILLGGFSAIALVLAAVGIYGVISYAVGQRTRELGIRIALGATHRRVVRLVLRQSATLVVAGSVIGGAAAYWLTETISGLLFGVEPLDLVTFASVPVVLIGVAAVATIVPARRAARVDPVIDMRAE
jgi:putative ABC transport system permease protein